MNIAWDFQKIEKYFRDHISFLQYGKRRKRKSVVDGIDHSNHEILMVVKDDLSSSLYISVIFVIMIVEKQKNKRTKKIQ